MGHRSIQGSIRGTGANLDIKTVGFRPREVEITNATSGDTLKWHGDMADAAGYKRVAAGTGAMISTGGVTPLADGFRIGADTDINVSTELLHWTARE